MVTGLPVQRTSPRSCPDPARPPRRLAERPWVGREGGGLAINSPLPAPVGRDRTRGARAPTADPPEGGAHSPSGGRPVTESPDGRASCQRLLRVMESPEGPALGLTQGSLGAQDLTARRAAPGAGWGVWPVSGF